MILLCGRGLLTDCFKNSIFEYLMKINFFACYFVEMSYSNLFDHHFTAYVDMKKGNLTNIIVLLFVVLYIFLVF